MEKAKYEGSPLAYSSCVDYSLYPTDITSTNSMITSIYPNSNYSDPNNPISIFVPATNSLYTSLAESYLYIKCAIKNADGTDLAEDADVGFVENAYASLFENISMDLNSIQITKPSVNLYHYQYFLENLIGTSSATKKSSMTSELFYEDVGAAKAAGNIGYNTRKKFTAKSQPVELIGRISTGISNQNRYLPPDINIKFTLRRAPVNFSLVGAKVEGKTFPYQIEFQSVVFNVKRYAIDPKVSTHHSRILANNHRLNFPILSSEMRYYWNAYFKVCFFSFFKYYYLLVGSFLIVSYNNRSIAKFHIGWSS